MKRILFLSIFTIVSYFSVNAQYPNVDTIFLGDFKLLDYSRSLVIQPKDYETIMTPYFGKERYNVEVDLLNFPVELDPELDEEEYRRAKDNHPWTRWANKMKAKVFDTDLMKMVETKADSLGLKRRRLYGDVYFDREGKLLSYSVTVPSEVLDFLTPKQLEQFGSVCLNEAEGGKVPKNVMDSVYLRLSTPEFLDSMRKVILEHQEKVKKGEPPFRGHFFNHFLPIEDRPKSDYGKLSFMKDLGTGGNAQVAPGVAF